MLVWPGEVSRFEKRVAHLHQKKTAQHHCLCWVLVAEGGGYQCAAGVDGCGMLTAIVPLVRALEGVQAWVTSRSFWQDPESEW